MEMKKYQGSCHCGKLEFEVETDLGKVISCNCSHCAMKGLLLTFVPAEQFTLLSGENELTEYLFNKKLIRHLFCKTCGVQPIGCAKNQKGKDSVAINVRCLKDVDLDMLTLMPYNGKDI